MDKNTEYYYKSAQRYLLPVELVNDIDGFALTLGKKKYFFRIRETPFNNLSSSGIALNKYCTNKLLKSAGVPVPKAIALHFSEYEEGLLDTAIADMKFPLVAKPTLIGLGKDVLCNVKNIEQLKSYLEEQFPIYHCLSIEEFHGGLKSYRVLVYNNRVIGLIYREAAHVIGDSRHTISELIELTNKTRAKLNDALAPIVIDQECLMCLEEQKLTLDYIPADKEKIKLGYTSNASRGGIFESLDINKICKKNRKLMVRIAELLHLNLVGIDVECEDIGIPLESSKGVVLEVNHSPSIKIHENPITGSANPVTRKIIRKLIYRHPFAYLPILYKHQRSLFYVRSFIFLAFLIAFYKIASQII